MQRICNMKCVIIP